MLRRTGWAWVAVRVVGLLGALTALYVAVGFGFALGGSGWWAAAGLLGVVTPVGAALASMAMAERRWPVLPVLLAGVALLVVCPEVAHARLRDHGARVTVTVVESSCEPGRAKCAPHYRVRRPDGSELPRPLSPPGGARHAPGDRVEVVEDPGGVLAPRRVSDLTDDAGERHVLRWSAGALVLLVVAAGLTGEPRRRRLVADGPRGW
ncbi:hypothetical protein SAMN05444320_103414 [Streptoalloteichus hindustanus]|uniref:Uncharacterized protein n=2 Tax=Streptoalloteichus hindustanus TaxID=2017 RepID=A0A1M5B6H9_STRHI|nr:hypothetical protein SAMN05444320_103414 [Streptoalloteichus hindustanus]